MEPTKTTLTFALEPEMNDHRHPFSSSVIGSGSQAETARNISVPTPSSEEDFDTIEYSNNTVSIGSEVTISSLIKSEIIRVRFPALVQSILLSGFQFVRNGNTVGSTLIAGGSDGDLPSALMVYNAWVKLDSTVDSRIIAINDFFSDSGKTVMLPDETLTEIILDNPPPYTGTDYLRQYHRNSRDIILATVASRVTLDKPDGMIEDAQIVVSAATPKACHAKKAEKALIGRYPSEALFLDAAQIAAEEIIPAKTIKDMPAYRRSVISVLTRRTLWKAVDQIKP